MDVVILVLKSFLKLNIFRETVNRLRSIKNERNRREENNKKNESKTSLLPKEVLGNFMFTFYIGISEAEIVY